MSKVLVAQSCPTLWPHGLEPSRLLCPWNSWQRYWSGLPFPSPGDLLAQGSNLGPLPCRPILYHLSHQGSPNTIQTRSQKWTCMWICQWITCVSIWKMSGYYVSYHWMYKKQLLNSMCFLTFYFVLGCSRLTMLW